MTQWAEEIEKFDSEKVNTGMRKLFSKKLLDMGILLAIREKMFISVKNWQRS